MNGYICKVLLIYALDLAVLHIGWGIVVEQLSVNAESQNTEIENFYSLVKGFRVSFTKSLPSDPGA